MMENEQERVLVLPGDRLENDDLKPGTGTYRTGEGIFASQVGIKNIRAGYVNVIPLGGKYTPRKGDSVIGIVEGLGPNFWNIRINCPYPANLHINEVPWKVEFGETARHLNVGDAVLVKITQVDETKRVQVTLKEHGLRKLTSGTIINVSNSKVPRIIGKGGSMISLIKGYTGCRIFVGQNGTIWLDGEPDDLAVAAHVVEMIDAHTQASGLTDMVRHYLKDKYPDAGPMENGGFE